MGRVRHFCPQESEHASFKAQSKTPFGCLKIERRAERDSRKRLASGCLTLNSKQVKNASLI